MEIEKEPSERGKLIGEIVGYHAPCLEQDLNAALVSLIRKYHTDAAYQIAEVCVSRRVRQIVRMAGARLQTARRRTT